MLDFKAKVHQYPISATGVAYSAPPDLLADLRGLLLRVGEGKGGSGEVPSTFSADLHRWP